MAMVLGTFIFSFLVFGLVVPVSNAQDLNGKWYIETGDEFVDVVDVAGAVSMTLDVAGNPVPFTGTLTGSTLALTGTHPICFGGCVIEATTLYGNEYFDGHLGIQTSVGRILASRCECFDGNTVDGDGCDAMCRVEPCFSCTGTPSNCTPTPNGGSCSDASACTSGDVCTAGVCSGSPVTPCVDMTGTWDTVEDFGGFGTVSDVWEIEQRENIVLYRNQTSGTPGSFGLIDTVTGEFDLKVPATHPFCLGSFSTRTGTAALDGQTYAATGVVAVAGGIICSGLSFTETATRQGPSQVSMLSRFGGIALALSLVAMAAFLLDRTRGRAR